MYNLYFYKNINDENEKECLSKHTMSKKDFDNFLCKRSDKLIIRAMQQGNNIHKISARLKIYCDMFEQRRCNRDKVSKNDHTMYIYSLAGLHRLKKINIFDRILMLKKKRFIRGSNPKLSIQSAL